MDGVVSLRGDWTAVVVVSGDGVFACSSRESKEFDGEAMCVCFFFVSFVKDQIPVCH